MTDQELLKIIECRLEQAAKFKELSEKDSSMIDQDVLQALEKKFDQAAKVVALHHKVSLTPEEVEALYGYHPTTLKNWRYEGRGPKFVKDGGIIRYRQKDLQAYQETRLVRTQDMR